MSELSNSSAETPKPRLRIMIVEDHELTRQGLSYGLRRHAGFEIVAEAEDGAEAVTLATELKPDVILMDIGLPVLNGIQATRQIKSTLPNTKILMLTSHSEQGKIFEAFAAGANGYSLKEVKTERLIQVIEMLPEDVVWLDPGIAGLILKVLPLMAEAVNKADEKSPNFEPVQLTAREKEILKLIAQGLNNKDIAEQLSISLFTVKNHVSNIIQKLAVEDRTQAAILALKRGIV